jgi:16S rRNA (guanine(527)-N(7))-methyltransferase RsmG
MKAGGVDVRVESAIRRSELADLAPDAREGLVWFTREVDLWSERIHLVGRGRRGRNIGLLVLDSLLLLRVAEERGLVMNRAADVGSGAGFPGMVWKIARPRLDLTLFERRLKPQLFLERIVAHSGLAGVRVVAAEAERAGNHGGFDLVVSKAAGRIETMLPLAEELLRPGGAYLTVKGRLWREEAEAPGKGPMPLEAAVALPEKRGTALIFRKTGPA